MSETPLLSTEHFPFPWTRNGNRHGEFIYSFWIYECR